MNQICGSFFFSHMQKTTGKSLHETFFQMRSKKRVQVQQMLACPLALCLHLEDVLSLLCKYRTLFTLRCCDLSLLPHSQEVYLVDKVQLPWVDTAPGDKTRIIILINLEYVHVWNLEIWHFNIVFPFFEQRTIPSVYSVISITAWILSWCGFKCQSVWIHRDYQWFMFPFLMIDRLSASCLTNQNYPNA